MREYQAVSIRLSRHLILLENQSDGHILAFQSVFAEAADIGKIACLRIGQRPVADIKAAEILVILQRLERAGKRETTRRARLAIGEVFRYAIRTLRAEHDPTHVLRGAIMAPGGAYGGNGGRGRLLQSHGMYPDDNFDHVRIVQIIGARSTVADSTFIEVFARIQE